MADITRDQFDESLRVEKKILQKGVHLLDSDFNEIVDILKNRDRRQLALLIGSTDVRFGNGWKIEGTGASLQVTLRAGWGAFLMAAQSAVLLQLGSDQAVSGFTTWSGARTDYVYLDLWELEVGPETDPNLVHPLLGQPTMVDVRLQYAVAISEGAVPGAPPAGHVYVNLASVTKTSGSQIDPGDVTLLLSDFNEVFALADGAVLEQMLATGAVTETKIADDAVTAAKINADVAGDGLSQAAGGALQVDAVRTVEGDLLRFKYFTGTFNMNTTGQVDVAHGIGDYAKIRVVSCCIIANDGTGYDFRHYDDPSNKVCGITVVNATQVQLRRVAGSLFASDANFTAATYHLTIAYVV